MYNKLARPKLDYDNKDYFFLFTETGYYQFIESFKKEVEDLNKCGQKAVLDLTKQDLANEWFLEVYKITELSNFPVAYEDKLQIALCMGDLPEEQFSDEEREEIQANRARREERRLQIRAKLKLA